MNKTKMSDFFPLMLLVVLLVVVPLYVESAIPKPDAPQYFNRNYAAEGQSSTAQKVVSISEGESPFVIHNSGTHDVWAKVRILSPGSTLDNRIDSVPPQIVRVPASGDSAPVLRRKFNNGLAISFWEDPECTRRIMLGSPATVLGLQSTSSMHMAGMDRIVFLSQVGLIFLHRNFTHFQCPICMEEHPEQNIIVLSCGHKMHSECGKKAIERNPECPLCRKHVDPTKAYSYDTKKGDFVTYTPRNRSIWEGAPVND